jgi:hypothetical protein
VSATGVALQTRWELKADTPILLELTGATYTLMAVPARVVHSREETDGYWLSGCTFDKPLSAEQLQALV